MLELKALHLCTYPLTSGITTGTLLSDSKLQWASEYQMSLWKFSWEYTVKRKHGLPQSPSPYKYRVTFQKGAQVSDLLILSMWTGAVLTLPCHSIKLKPWVKIKPWPLHIIIINVIRRKVIWFSHNEQHGQCPTCVMLLPPHTHTHTNTRRPSNMHRCTWAQKQKPTASYTTTLCSQMSPTNRPWGERCSDAETGAIYRASCSLPGNYHIKLICPMVLTGPRPSHYSLV